MAQTQKIQLIVDAENRTKTAMSSVNKSLDTVKGKLDKLQPAFKKMAIAGTVAFAAIGGGIFKATQDATAAQEVFNKFDVVFGDVSDQAEKVAQDLRDNFGLAESSAKELLSSTGDMLTGFGLSGAAALDLAEKTNKLAVDLASFTNLEGGAERASKALTKALLGERESVKELGIAILEEDVKAKVAAMEAAGEFTDETLRQKRALATLEIAIGQSKNAIGDFARTEESLANQQRVLKERTKELSETLGKVFMPVFQKVTERLLPLIEKMAEWTKEHPKLTLYIGLAAIALAGLIATLGLLGIILPGVITAVVAIGGVIGGITLPILAVIAAFVALGIAIAYIALKWDQHVDNMKWAFGIFKESIGAVIEWVKDKFGAFVSWIDDKVQAVIDSVKRAISVVADIPGVGAITGAVKAVGGAVSKAWDFVTPREHGGPVTAGEPYLVGERGPELFTPGQYGKVAGAGGMNITINIQGNEFMGEEGVAERIGNSIMQSLKNTVKL